MNQTPDATEGGLDQAPILQDRYQLLDELGQGGMGIVYQAIDLLLERSVAVKVLSKTDPTGDQRHRLLAEAKATAKLNHPNVVSIHDAGEHGGVPFIVMERIEGNTLRETNQPTLETTISLAQDMSSALAHAHQNGIIHRDLKPENVMITIDNQAKLMDFGLARVSGRSNLTAEGRITGTIAYLAPELIIGQPASERSDLYALGVILYELTTGRPPFEGDNLAVLLSNHLHAPVIPPIAHNPSLPNLFDALIVQLLEKDPTSRPQSAAEVLDRLSVISDPTLAGLPATLESPVTSLLDRIASGRLVSREEELAEATALWLRSLSGQAGLLLISGEPGIGKTRLSQAVIAQARIGGATVLNGGCYEFEATTPYLPFSEALREWVRNRDLEPMRDELGETATELARLAPEISVKLGPLIPSPALGPEEQRIRLFDNIAQFFEKIAGDSGLLLFVDDLHWADRGTLTLLTYLMRRLRHAPLLVIAAYREIELDRKHRLADALVHWNRQRVAVRIQLARFTLAETNRMIATLFWEDSVSDEFAEVIYRETDGNPFFIEEVVKALVEQGQVFWAGDHWDREELDQLAIPQSIKEAIGRRLNSLTEYCVETLHTAAVIGKDFPYSLLSAVSDFDTDRLLDALDEASNAQLIRQLGGDSFVFTHDKIREVLYDEILGVRRSRLHLHIARSLEVVEEGKSPARVEDLAYHFIAAGSLKKGMEYALLAAYKAQELFAGDEVVEYLRQALECAVSLNDLSAQATILEYLGDIFGLIGPFDASIEHYHQAARITTENRAAIEVKIGLVLNTTNDEKGIPILENALDELDPEEDPVPVAQALTALGRFYHYRCEYSSAIHLYEQARELAEPIGDPRSLTFIYAYLAAAYQHLAHMDLSMEWAESAIRMGKENNYLPAVAVGHEFIAENNIIMGYWDQALESAKKDGQVGGKIGSAGRIAWSSWSAGYALYGKGELRDAVAELDKAVDLAITIGENRLEALCYSTLSLAHADLGIEVALDYVARAIEGGSKMVELFQLGNAHHVGGYVNLQLGHLQAALEAFEASRDLLEGTESRDVALYRLPYHAETLLYLNDYDAAAILLSASLELSQEVGAPHYEAVTHRVYGLLHLEQGNIKAAIDALDRASAIAEMIGSQVELGRIYFSRALIGRRSNELETARLYASKAEAIFTSCDAGRDLTKTLTLLDQIH